MGGFTIDGCGVGDSFYPKQDLGSHYCSYCKSVQQFALMEVRRKIKVFYIPTVSINTKFAVGCKKCQNGYYIDDKQRDDILYGRAQIEVKPDRVLVKSRQEFITPDVPQRSISTDNGGDRSCPMCGKPQPGTGQFCVYCGASLTSQQAQPKERFCTLCGAKVQQGQIFCGECGTKVN